MARANVSAALPGEEAWLIGEHPASGERKYFLSNLPGDCTLKTLAAAVKARWACEQAHKAAASHRRMGEKRVSGPPPQPSLPAIRQAILAQFLAPFPHRCPRCKTWLTHNLPKQR